MIKESDDKTMSVIANRRGYKIFFCKKNKLQDGYKRILLMFAHSSLYNNYVSVVSYQWSHCCLIRTALGENRWVSTSGTPPRKQEYSRTDNASSTMTPHHNQAMPRWYYSFLRWRAGKWSGGICLIRQVLCAVNKATTSAVCLLCVIL